MSKFSCLILTTEHELQMLIESRATSTTQTFRLGTLPFGIDGAQIHYMYAINRGQVDCTEEPGSTMVATSFWNAFTRSLAAHLKGYFVDAMKIWVVIYLELPEGCGKREARDSKNAENRLQWFNNVFRSLCNSDAG